MKTAQQVFDFLIAYMDRFPNVKSDWYAGIAANNHQRLFEDHGVDEHNGCWAFDTCMSSSDARAVEETLLRLGCKGGPGGGDHTTTGCYVYLITHSTRE